MAIDIDRIAASAMRAYLEAHSDDGSAPPAKRGRRRLRRAGTLALGVGLACAAGVAYNHLREFDLERAGAAIEEKLNS